MAKLTCLLMIRPTALFVLSIMALPGCAIDRAFSARSSTVTRNGDTSAADAGVKSVPSAQVPPSICRTQVKPAGYESSTREEAWSSDRLHNPSDILRLPSIEEELPDTLPDFPDERTHWWDKVLADHANYYSGESLAALGVGFGVGALIANTQTDEVIRRNYQEDVQNAPSDEYFEAVHASKELGNGAYTIPAFAAAALAGGLFDDTALGHGVGQWGRRCLRTVLVGGPPMLAMQAVTGASRPGETDAGSHWKPFQDVNGVSGHSFMGAVPFISAAKMTDSLFSKTIYYLASAVPAVSRVNDDYHYASQVMLGWWMAYVAASAVDKTEQHFGSLTVCPVPINEGIGLGVEFRR